MQNKPAKPKQTEKKKKTIPASSSSTELIPAVGIRNSQSNEGFHIF